MKNQKGITLVALIITIIVMLILAGVSISLVVGENGVLTQATKAGETTKKAEAEQAIRLAIADLMMQKYSDTSTNPYTTDKFETALGENGLSGATVGDTTFADDVTLEVTVGKDKYNVVVDKGTTGVYSITSITKVEE